MTPRRWFHLLLGAVFVPVLTLPLVWAVAIRWLRRATDAESRRWARNILALAAVDTLVVAAGGLVLAQDKVATVGGPVALAADRVVIGVVPDRAFAGPGARIDEVHPGWPADVAGVTAGDVITRVAGVEIHDPASLRAVVGDLEPGVEVALEIERGPSRLRLRVTPRRAAEVPRGDARSREPGALPASCFPRPGAPASLFLVAVAAATAALAALVARRSPVRGSARGVWWAGLSLVGGMLAAYAVPTGACVLLGPRATTDVLLAAWGSSLALAALAVAGRRSVGGVAGSSSTRTWRSAVGWGAWYILTGTVRLGVLLAAATLLAYGHDTGSNPVQAVARGLAAADRGPVLLLLFAVPAILVAPVGEEIAFRGLLQPALGPWLGPAAAIALTAVLFGAAHWYYGMRIPLVVLVGAVLGWARLTSGGLRAPIVLHVAVNAVAFTAGLLDV